MTRRVSPEYTIGAAALFAAGFVVGLLAVEHDVEAKRMDYLASCEPHQRVYVEVKTGKALCVRPERSMDADNFYSISGR